MLCAHMEVLVLFVFISTDQAGSKSYLTLQYAAPMSVHTRMVIKTFDDPCGYLENLQVVCEGTSQLPDQSHKSAMPFFHRFLLLGIKIEFDKSASRGFCFLKGYILD